MLHTSLIPSLLATASDHTTRPILAHINITEDGVWETTDSYTLTRITPKEPSQPFPVTKNFFPATPSWEPVSLQNLLNACDSAILLAKQLKTKSHLIIGQENTTLQSGHFLQCNLNHGLTTAVDARLLIKFLKPLKNNKDRLEWYQETPLSPLALRMITQHGTIEYLIMPLKI